MRFVTTSCFVVLCFLFLQAQGDFIVNQFANCTTCNVIKVVSVSDSVILVWTEDALYRTDNAGQDWTQLGFSVLWFDVYDDPNNFVFFNSSKTFYSSKDGGATITTGATITPTKTTNLVLHPYKVGWLYSLAYNSSTNWLMYSKDFGYSWTIGITNVDTRGPAFWGLDPHYPDVVYLTLSTGSSRSYGYTGNYQASNWTTLFSQQVMNAWMTNNFHYILTTGTRRQLYVARGPSTYSSRQNYVAVNLNYTSSPTPEVTFLDDSSFVAVFGYVFSSGSTWGPVFVSDSTGVDFFLSLPFVAGNAADVHYFDILPVTQGLMGMYLANYYVAGNQIIGRQTRITYNAGRTWSPIPAPAKDFNGQPTNCSISDGCSLNLCVKSYIGVPGFYTSQNSIGVIIANGNLGTALLKKTEGMSSYISYDAGFSWSELYPGPIIVAVGEKSMLFASSDYTTIIMYSAGKSASFSRFTFTQIPLRILKITPLGPSTFMVSGIPQKPSYNVFILDFSQVNDNDNNNDNNEIPSLKIQTNDGGSSKMLVV